MASEPCVILRVHNHKAGYVLGLDAVHNRTQAEQLRGKSLTVPESELPQLDRDTFFYFDIIGMAVHLANGKELGRIEEILSAGGNDVYVIRGQGSEVLIPAVREYVVDVDVERAVMEVSLPEGYVEETKPRQNDF